MSLGTRCGAVTEAEGFYPLPLFITKTDAVTCHRPKLHAQSCTRRACPDKLTAAFPTPLKIRSDSGDIAPPLIHKALRPVARSDISRCHYGDTDVPPRHGSWQGKGHATMGNARRLPKGSGRARVDMTRANYRRESPPSQVPATPTVLPRHTAVARAGWPLLGQGAACCTTTPTVRPPVAPATTSSAQP